MNAPDKNDVVILELDRPRELRLGHKALKRFSALTGCSLKDMEDQIQNYDKMSAMLWIMVTEDQKEQGEEIMTPEVLDDLLDKHRVKISKILKVCSAALQAAFEDEDAESDEDAETPPQAAGTGDEA